MANSRKQSTNRHLPAGARRRQSGAAAVEFAIVFPLLFALMYGTIIYGIIFFAQQTINLVAQECAKAAVAVALTGQGGDPYQAAITAYLSAPGGPEASGGTLSLLPGGIGQTQVHPVYTPSNGATPGTVTINVIYTGISAAFPQIKFPASGIMGLSGGIPPIPTKLTASATVRVS